MKPKIRFGIIGCSTIAKKSTIPALKITTNAKLQMIGSRSLKKAKDFSKKFSCKLFGSYEEVLENKEIDAVYLSLPPALHEKWAIKSAKAGKHILCEKSVTTSFLSAKKIVTECQKNNVRIMEGFAFEFHPQQIKIQNIVRTKIGNLISFNGSFGFNLPYTSDNFRFKKELGGGSLNDMGCYFIKASQLLFQSYPSSVFCDLYFDNKGVDVRGFLSLKFSNNRFAIGIFSYENFFKSKYDIWGTKGLLTVERAFSFRKNFKPTLILERESKIHLIKIKDADPFQIMIQEFCNNLFLKSIKSNFETNLLRQAKIMETARRSNSKNHPVSIQDI